MSSARLNESIMTPTYHDHRSRPNLKSLTDLPDELLLQVLRLVLISTFPIAPLRPVASTALRKRMSYDKFSAMRSGSGLSPQVLVCCKLFCELGTKMLYAENTIDLALGFGNTLTPGDFRSKIGWQKVQLITSIKYETQLLSTDPPEFKLASLLGDHPDDASTHAKAIRKHGKALDRFFGLKSRQQVYFGGEHRKFMRGFKGLRRLVAESNVLSCSVDDRSLNAFASEWNGSALEVMTWRCRLTPWEAVLNVKTGTLEVMMDGVRTVRKDVLESARAPSGIAQQ